MIKHSSRSCTLPGRIVLKLPNSCERQTRHCCRSALAPVVPQILLQLPSSPHLQDIRWDKSYTTIGGRDVGSVLTLHIFQKAGHLPYVNSEDRPLFPFEGKTGRTSSRPGRRGLPLIIKDLQHRCADIVADIYYETFFLPKPV